MKKLLFVYVLLLASLSTYAQSTSSVVRPTRFFLSPGRDYIVVSDSTNSGLYPVSQIRSVEANVDFITIDIKGKVVVFKPSQFLDINWVPFHSTNGKLAFVAFKNKYFFSISPGYDY